MRTLRIYIFVLAVWGGCLSSMAHDFEVGGIFFKRLSDNTCAVSFKGDYYTQYHDFYSGNIVVPAKVSTGSSTYTVSEVMFAAFGSCSGLKSVTLPNTITKIGDGAFANDPGLENFTIPASVTKIGTNPFEGSHNLREIKVESENFFFEKDGLYTSSGMLITALNKPTFELSDRLTFIGNESLAGCDKITSIEFPTTYMCDGIGEMAFSGCTGLSKIEIPFSVFTIGYAAFRYCENLKEAYIFGCLMSLADHAFYGCKSLESLHILAETPPYCGEAPFHDDLFSKCTLYVPKISIEIYRSTNPFSRFTRIEAEGSDGIADIEFDKRIDGSIYSINGCRVKEAFVKRIFIRGGKKFLNKRY